MNQSYFVNRNVRRIERCPRSVALSALAVLAFFASATSILPAEQMHTLTKLQQKRLNQLLLEAADNGDVKKVKSLVADGASIHAVGGKALLILCTCELDPDVGRDHPVSLVKYFIDHGADVNYGAGSETPLIVAAKNSNLEAACLLINHKANPNASDSDGKTAILYSARLGGGEDGDYCDPPMADLLLSAGAHPNDTDTAGNTPLILLGSLEPAVPYSGADHGDEPDANAIAVSLIKHGANVDAANKNGRTALIAAANSEGWLGPFCKTSLAHLLLAHGAQPNRVDKWGNTALIRLAGITNIDSDNSSDVAFARDLVHHGAIASLKNKDGHTALDIARMNHLKRLVRFLEAQKAARTIAGAKKVK
jgi:ankyrin repeat protein